MPLKLYDSMNFIWFSLEVDLTFLGVVVFAVVPFIFSSCFLRVGVI